MHPLFTNGLSTAEPLSLIGCQRAERRMKGWKTGGRERQHLKGSHFSLGDIVSLFSPLYLALSCSLGFSLFEMENEILFKIRSFWFRSKQLFKRDKVRLGF